MNRAERRRSGAKKEQIYSLSLSQIEKIKENTFNEALDMAFTLMLTIPVMVLHDKYSQLMKREENGKSREERFTDLALDLYDSFNRDYVTLEELKACLKEETGIDIKSTLDSKRIF